MPIGDKAWEEFIACSETKQLFRRVLLHMQEKAPENISDFDFGVDKDLKLSNGHYEVIYRPYAKQAKHASACPYIIRCDLFPGAKLRVSGYAHLKEIAKTNQAVAWMLKWTTISDKLFRIARVNFSMPITFTIKWIEYVENMKANNPDNKHQFIKEEWIVAEKYRAREAMKK